MTDTLRKLIWVISAIVLGIVLGGCAATPSHHKQAVNQANRHWHDMRSMLLLQTAQRQFDAADLEQASKTLSEALDRDPKNGRLHLLSGRLSLEKGRLERSLRQLELANELEPGLSQGYYYRGVVLQRWQQYERAGQMYRKAYQLEPDNVSYLMAISEMYLAAGHPDQALSLLKEKVHYFDQNAGIRTALAELYRMKRDYVHAVDYYRQATLLSPDDLTLAEELGRTQVMAGLYAQAAVTFEQMAADQTQAPRREIQLLLGRCYMALGRLAEADRLYRQLRQRDAHDVDAWQGLAEVAYRRQDWQQVLRAAGRMVSLSPDRSQGHLLTGLAWQQLGQPVRAASAFAKAAAARPDDAEPMILRGVVLQRAGEVEAAAEAYAEAIRRQPEDKRARTLLAQLSGG